MTDRAYSRQALCADESEDLCCRIVCVKSGVVCVGASRAHAPPRRRKARGGQRYIRGETVCLLVHGCTVDDLR